MIGVSIRATSGTTNTSEVGFSNHRRVPPLTTPSGIVQNLQALHDMLSHYFQPPVLHPTPESTQLKKRSLFSLFSSRCPRIPKVRISPSLPKGLYMYGDVGSGKTMLMDMFFDTLPPNIKAKTRIHFHSIMQGVHRELHKMKMKYGSDFDAIPLVAAEIAEKSAVLCFDEFQCTDVADAMILRRYTKEL